MTVAFTDLDGLVDRIPDGAIVALPQERAGGCAMALVRRVIQRGVRGLHLIGAQGGGIQVALLIGAGCVDTVDGVDVTAARSTGKGTAASASVQKADVAIFHIGKVDPQGNVWVGGMRHLRRLAAAATSIVASYEECVAEDLTATGADDTIPAAQVAALAEAHQGAWPLGLPGYAEADRNHLAHYANAAKTGDGLQTYLRNHVYQRLAGN